MIPPGLPSGLAGVAEHMRADALMMMAERGEEDVTGQWLWNLAERVEKAAVEDRLLHTGRGPARVPRPRTKASAIRVRQRCCA